MFYLRHYSSYADLLEIDTILAQKYGLLTCGIFLENDLLCMENRAIYGTAKGGHYYSPTISLIA